MLTRVSIHNYNCLADLELELPRRLLLVGSNGSGKSSLWEAFAALQDLVVHGADVADAFPTRSLTRWLDNATQRLSFDLATDAGCYTYTLETLHDTTRQHSTLRHERLDFEGHALYDMTDGEIRIYGDSLRPDGSPRTTFFFGRKRSFLSQVEPRVDNQRLIAFREAFHDIWLIKPASHGLGQTTADEAHWLERDGSNFGSWFRGVLADRMDVGSRLSESLRAVLPGLNKLGYEKVSQKVRELFFHFTIEGREFPVSVSELSDGQRNLVLLYGILVGAFDRAGVVFLDEPELGLAPHEMQPWLSQASAALDEHNGQLFVISHHPAVIDYLAPERTLRFHRPRGGRTMINDVTLETTHGARVSEWLTRPWTYEDEHAEQ